MPYALSIILKVVTLSFVVGAQHDGGVLEHDNCGDGPDDQGGCAFDIFRRDWDVSLEDTCSRAGGIGHPERNNLQGEEAVHGDRGRESSYHRRGTFTLRDS